MANGINLMAVMSKILKILITRPTHQSNEFCEAIRNMGALPVLFPTLEILPPSDMACFQATIQNLDTFDIVIFTSANSSLFFATVPKIQHSLILAIGPGTAKALKKISVPIHAMAPPPYTSESLLELPLLQNIKGLHVAIITGKEGRKLLADTLQQRGAWVDTVIAYERHLPAPNREGLEKILDTDIIVIHSAESLHNFMTLIRPYTDLFLKKDLLVINQKLKDLSEEAGFSNIIVAENASTAAILAALQEYIDGKSRRQSGSNPA